MKRAFVIAAILVFSVAAYSQTVKYLTTEEFKTLVCDYTQSEHWTYLSKTPCVIDFYTTWCGPCKRLAPIMEELAEKYKGQVVFYKVDIEKDRELAAVFGINSIPQILFCPLTGKPQLAKGLLPKETLEQAINEILLKK